MTTTNKKRHLQLGMPYGTANNKLRKAIMFQMIQRAGLDICFQCGKKIETIGELSIEHKESWLDKEDAKELFFDLDNIAFSHLKCNSGARVKPFKPHGKTAYQKGCRCSICVKANYDIIKKYRTKKKQEDPMYRRKIK